MELKNLTSKGSIALRAGRFRRRCFERYDYTEKGGLMFSIIKNLFSKNVDDSIQPRELNTYFLIELNESSCIPKEKYDLVLRHLNHQSKLDHKIIESEFNVDHDGANKIVAFLRNTYYKATCDKAWDDNYIKMYSSGVAKIAVLISAGTNEHCEYCLDIFDKEIPITVLTFHAFRENCSCRPYKKSYFKSIIRFG